MGWLRKWWPLLFGFVLMVPAIGAGLLLGAIFVTPLPPPHNPETTEIVDSAGRPLGQLFTENRQEIDVTEMPDYLLQAIVAVEDDRFYQHRGIDIYGISRAMVRNIQARSIREGGSTITQQLARNLYLSHERTWARKLREALLTLKLEMSYTKQEILGMYWNTIYLGAGAYGVEVAAQTYFDKSARDLTLSEAALLAGIPRSPEYYSPFNEEGKEALARRNLVLAKMVEHQFITPAQGEAARSEPLTLRDNGDAPPREAAYFLDYLLKEIRERYPELADTLYQGGYRIETTLDLDLQRVANTTVQKNLPEDETIQAALVAIEPESGAIRAMVGGRDPSATRNRALETNQPGSSFKPFVYAAALSTQKYTAADTQVDEPTKFPGAEPDQHWEPRNWNKKYLNRPTGMREAIADSLNVVAAQWAQTIGLSPIKDLARRSGITGMMPDDLTLALGTGEVSPLELTTSYAAFANGGFQVRPTAIRRILDRDGLILVEEQGHRNPVLDPGVAFIMTDMMKDVLKPGGTSVNLAKYFGRRPVAGKTGTTDDGRSAWFVGYTPNLVAGVWVGTDDDRPSNRSGSYSAGPIWAEFLSKAEADKPPRDWEPPQNVESVRVCTLSGLLPNITCPTRREWFVKGTAPTKVDPVVHWRKVLPELPGVPWVPDGTIPQIPEDPRATGQSHE